jgi:LmbE family N-acetylglucosaminyl deacetylase
MSVSGLSPTSSTRYGQHLPSAEHPLRSLWQRDLIRRSVDVTAATTGRTCVVLAPHPDDETLGCGATIARKRAAGTRVLVAVVTDGRYSHPHSNVVTAHELRQIRAAEAAAASARLGVPSEDLVLLGYEDAHLHLWTDHAATTIAELLTAEAPDEVYVSSRLDRNRDHVALNEALRIALTKTGARPRVLEYPIWYWLHGPWRAHRVDNVVVRHWTRFADPVTALLQRRPVAVATAGFLPSKRDAIAEHASQFTNLTGEAEWAVLDEEFAGEFLTAREIFFPWNDREV